MPSNGLQRTRPFETPNGLRGRGAELDDAPLPLMRKMLKEHAAMPIADVGKGHSAATRSARGIDGACQTCEV